MGEGVFGLQRAFTLAGAKTLVLSLWSVPDEVTRLLMEDFYRRLLAGEGKAEALRQAQEAIRTDGKHADPYYWGAFICQGEPGPLRTGSVVAFPHSGTSQPPGFVPPGQSGYNPVGDFPGP